jgi:uncharacterized protein YlbG (UPF0298 family)
VDVTHLSKHIDNYLKHLKNTQALKNIGRIHYSIKESKKSISVYVKLSLEIMGNIYTKSIRFSDHQQNKKYYQKRLEDVLFKPGDLLSKKEKKYIEAKIRKAIKLLVHNANVIAVTNF